VCRPRIVIRTAVDVINMTVALRWCHLARGGRTNLKKRAATRLPCQRIIIIPIAAVLSGAIAECKVALIGGGADGAARSHYDYCVVLLDLFVVDILCLQLP